MGLGKMVEFYDSSITLVYEKIVTGPGRTIASLIISALLLMYYLVIENSSSASPNLAVRVFLPTLNFAALHLFVFLIFHEQRFSAFFQRSRTVLLPLVEIFLTFVVGYVNYLIMVTPRQSINWRLVLFVLSYATFHFLLVINEIRGENFKLTKNCFGAAFFFTIFIQQWKTFGAIVTIVLVAILFLEDFHIHRTRQPKSKGAAYSVLKQQPMT